MLYDLGIIGGGLAGGLSAILSVRAGHSTILFEKESKAHHKVCGEFISAEGADCLTAAGVALDQLGATRINWLTLNGPHQTFSCPLPWVARGISRYVLDRELLKLAREAGCDVREGASVSNVRTDSAVSIDVRDSGSFTAKRVLVATGKHDLRGVAERKGRDSDYVGYKMHLSLEPSVRASLDNRIELFVFSGGYAGLSLVENSIANICFIIEKPLAKMFGLKWDQIATELSHLAPALGRYLSASHALWDRPLTIAPIPYGFVRKATSDSTPLVQFLGDQLAVIPSLTGDGMSIALNSAVLAHKGRGLSQENLRSQIRSGYRLQMLFRRPALLDFCLRILGLLPKSVSQRIIRSLFLSTRFQ